MEALGRSKAVPLHIKTFGLQKKKKRGDLSGKETLETG